MLRFHAITETDVRGLFLDDIGERMGDIKHTVGEDLGTLKVWRRETAKYVFGKMFS